MNPDEHIISNKSEADEWIEKYLQSLERQWKEEGKSLEERWGCISIWKAERKVLEENFKRKFKWQYIYKIYDAFKNYDWSALCAKYLKTFKLLYDKNVCIDVICTAIEEINKQYVAEGKSIDWHDESYDKRIASTFCQILRNQELDNRGCN